MKQHSCIQQQLWGPKGTRESRIMYFGGAGVISHGTTQNTGPLTNAHLFPDYVLWYACIFRRLACGWPRVVNLLSSQELRDS